MTQASKTTLQILRDGFLRPFDISSPMARRQFWLFYLAWLGMLHLVAVLSVIVAPAVLETFGKAPAVILNLCLAALVFLGLCGLVSAIARRMKDAGYRRLYLAGLLATAAGFVASFLRDVMRGFEAAQDQVHAAPVAWSQVTFLLLLSTLPFLFIVFRGTIRPTKTEKAA